MQTDNQREAFDKARETFSNCRMRLLADGVFSTEEIDVITAALASRATPQPTIKSDNTQALYFALERIKELEAQVKRLRREKSLDELTAEAQRLGFYGDAPQPDNVVEAVAKAIESASCPGGCSECRIHRAKAALSAIPNQGEWNEAIKAAAKVCRGRVMGDNNREDAEAQRCAEAIEKLERK